MKGKSEERAICTASAVLPHPTGPAININTINLHSVHATPEEFENTALSTVRSTAHTNPSRKQKTPASRSAHIKGLVARTCFGDQSPSVYSYFASKF